MPFLSFAIIHIAISHLSRPTALSSKMVPTLTLNCHRGCRVLQAHTRRDGTKVTSSDPHVGHATPLGQRNEAAKLRQTSGLEKYRMASTSVCGSWVMARSSSLRNRLAGAVC